jgi:hypothetical protein
MPQGSSCFPSLALRVPFRLEIIRCEIGKRLSNIHGQELRNEYEVIHLIECAVVG